MEKNNNSYRQIFKATSIFGSVQVFNIIISVIRSKVIAILLGPSGIGLVSLYTTTIGLITGATNFGLGTSAVKNIAASSSSNDKNKIAKTIIVFRRLVWITGGFGFVLTLILAPWLSRIAFGNKAHTVAFMLLSITLLFTQISASQSVILQGMRKIQYMAKATMLGALFGLLISLPLYYFLSNKGIVPAILLSAISLLFCSWFYAQKVKIQRLRIDKVSFRTEGVEMLKMGFIISLGGLISSGSSYVVRIFISNTGGIVDVGLFSAGFAIIGTYISTVFTAMSIDYYPRLAAISKDNIACKIAVNQQAEIAILILAPILIVFIVFIKSGIIFLYSKEFIGIIDMMRWATLGVFFQAISWSIGYILLAKGAPKPFFWNETLAYSYKLLFNILGYHYYGLTGLGMSYLLGYFSHFIHMLFISRRLYNFNLENETSKVFIFQISLGIACFLCMIFLINLLAYIFGCILIVISIFYSWKKLNARIGLKKFIFDKIK